MNEIEDFLERLNKANISTINQKKYGHNYIEQDEIDHEQILKSFKSLFNDMVDERIVKILREGYWGKEEEILNEFKYLKNTIFNIIVNGKPYQIIGNSVSYEKILGLLQEFNFPSMTFRNGYNNSSGILYPGKSCQIQNGTIFNCFHTGNA